MCRMGPPEAALAWFARMQHDGIHPNTAACNIAMRCQAATGNLRTAVQLLTSMMRQSDGASVETAASPPLPPPDEVSFNTVISALAHAQQPDKAEALLLQMIDTGLYEPSAISFTSVITGESPSQSSRVAVTRVRVEARGG